MKYFLIAGEASGDMHGAKLMTELKKFDVKADFMYFGGDLMKTRGRTLETLPRNGLHGNTARAYSPGGN